MKESWLLDDVVCVAPMLNTSPFSRPKQRRPSTQLDDSTLASVHTPEPWAAPPARSRPARSYNIAGGGPTLTRQRLLALLIVLGLALFYLLAPSHSRQSPLAGQILIPSTGHSAQGVSLQAGPRRPVSSNLNALHAQKYLAYNSHSGYHNQRIALENALTLAKLTNRTLLLPPVRLGSAVPWVQYGKMRGRLQQSNKVGLEHCKDFSQAGLLPRECAGYFDWTLVNWDLFVDVDKITDTLGQPIVDAWDESDAFVRDQLQLDPVHDVHTLAEKDLYAYRFYDSPSDTEPLDKFQQRVELASLQALDAPLLRVGSLFGTSRLRTVEEAHWEVRSAFRQAMVFRRPTLDALTDGVRDMLGGSTAYFSVHMRIGDGVFRTEARSNVEIVWRELLEKRMKLDPDTVEKAWAEFGFHDGSGEQQQHPKARPFSKRNSIPALSDYAEAESNHNFSLVKRASNSRPQRPGAYKHPWPKGPPLVTSRKNSPLDKSLQCRGPLHTRAEFYKFNYPLFVATDSRNPATDPLLRPLFDTFPCTFVLSDFSQHLSGVSGWKNEEDHVDLSQFMWPVIDMMIAAKGRNIAGTPQSTFSRFATDVLFQSYHGWDIIERG